MTKCNVFLPWDSSIDTKVPAKLDHFVLHAGHVFGRKGRQFLRAVSFDGLIDARRGDQTFNIGDGVIAGGAHQFRDLDLPHGLDFSQLAKRAVDLYAHGNRASRRRSIQVRRLHRITDGSYPF